MPFGRLFSKSEKPEVPLDEIRPMYYEEMKNSLTAYFNTHALDRDKLLASGLTIPWFAADENDNSVPNFSWGYLIAKGTKFNEDAHVFDAITCSSFSSGSYKKTVLAIKP